MVVGLPINGICLEGAASDISANCINFPEHLIVTVLLGDRIISSPVAGLCAKFGMLQNEFARLLGVSAPSVGNSEKMPGMLNLQTRTLAAWDVVKKLTKTQAWQKLHDSWHSTKN